MRLRPWLVHGVAAVALALAVHALAVWAVPRFIMGRLLAAVAAETQATGVMLPPPSDHTQRRVVMPSPDLLYALCPYDLERGPLRVRAAPHWPAYWSIALYTDDSDNVFVLNDREAAAGTADLVITGAPGAKLPGAAATAAPAGADGGAAGTIRRVAVTRRRGLVLMRLLLTDPVADLPRAEAARRTLRCETLS